MLAIEGERKRIKCEEALGVDKKYTPEGKKYIELVSCVHSMLPSALELASVEALSSISESQGNIDLNKKNLSYTSLINIKLQGANLNQVDFSGAILKNANLRNAQLNDSDLSLAIPTIL